MLTVGLIGFAAGWLLAHPEAGSGSLGEDILGDQRPQENLAFLSPEEVAALLSISR
ncbi:MAG: hypothetical protein AAGN46_14440 [Acidobacteriota bacterium]